MPQDSRIYPNTTSFPRIAIVVDPANGDQGVLLEHDDINHEEFDSLADLWATFPQRLREHGRNLAELEEQLNSLIDTRDEARWYLMRLEELLTYAQRLLREGVE